MRKLYLAHVAALTMTACTTPVATPAPVSSSATTVTPQVIATPSPAARPNIVTAAARGFAAAEIEWQSAIAVGRALVARGVIRGETAVVVRGWNARARTLIVAGKAATNAAEQARLTAELLGLTSRLDAITGRK